MGPCPTIEFDRSIRWGRAPPYAWIIVGRFDRAWDYRQAVAAYEGIADIRLFEGGSHAFDHMDEAVDIIGVIHRALEEGKSANERV